MIILIGAKGSMGRRYQAILRYLGQDFIGFDIGQETEAMIAVEHRSSGVIIASPTNTHECYLQALFDVPVPILCEKPITKDLLALEKILARPLPFRMMMQYQLLDPAPHPVWTEDSMYDYYHSGTDGLGWDCMQLLGLARGTIMLKTESPTWVCILNGVKLTLDQMHQAYVDYVLRWLKEPDEPNKALIVKMHEKAAAWKI